MRVLVVGADRVDAGKTTFSVGLLESLDAVGFKPRAGNDFWFHQDDLAACLAEGTLHGHDATRLAAASDADVDATAINPVHRAWRPAPGTHSSLLGQAEREFLVDRVGDRFVVNDTVDLPPAITEALPLADATRVDSLAALNAVMGDLHVPALDAFREEITAAERAVVESYGDVARPLRGVDPDVVAVVEPGRVQVADGGRFARACEVATGDPDTGQLEERVESVMDLVDVEQSVALPALTSEERASPSTVATAYEAAYDAVLAAMPR